MNFHLQEHLKRELAEQAHQFAFTARTEAEFSEWQSDFREALTDLLGLSGRLPSHVSETMILRSEDKGRYIEEKHVISLDDVSVPMYLLIPKAPPPYKAIVALHGHGMGVKQILGHYPDEAITQKMLSQDENFAQRFAKEGYLVCAIEQQGFGERVARDVSENANSCRQLAMQYMMQGKNLLGERVREAIASINYLHSRDDILADSIGCTGHSGGGATALFLSALDTRLTTTVISGYFCDYGESILGMRHCECNYVPNLLTLGNIGEIAGLIAPRALRLINGEADHIFPINGAQQVYDTVQSIYALTKAEEKLSLVTHPQGHRYDYRLALEWFEAYL